MDRQEAGGNAGTLGAPAVDAMISPVHVPSTTLGIDLAAQPRETAACVIRWGEDAATVESLAAGLDDRGLLATVEQHAPRSLVV